MYYTGMAISEWFVINGAEFFMDTYFTMVIIVGKTEIEVFYSIEHSFGNKLVIKSALWLLIM